MLLIHEEEKSCILSVWVSSNTHMSTTGFINIDSFIFVVAGPQVKSAQHHLNVICLLVCWDCVATVEKLLTLDYGHLL